MNLTFFIHHFFVFVNTFCRISAQKFKKGTPSPQFGSPLLMIAFFVVRQLSGTYVRKNFRFFCCLPTVRHIRSEKLSDLSGNPLTAYLPTYILLDFSCFVNTFCRISAQKFKKGTPSPQFGSPLLMIAFFVVRQPSSTFVRKHFRFFCCLPTLRHIRPATLSDLSGNPLTAYLPNSILSQNFVFVNSFCNKISFTHSTEKPFPINRAYLGGEECKLSSFLF